MFQDITTLLLDHKAFKDTIDIFVERYREMDISVVAGTVFLDIIPVWDICSLPRLVISSETIRTKKTVGFSV